MTDQPTTESTQGPLAPCPFCGGKADLQGWKASDGRTGPECEDCGATAGSAVDWNHRPPDTSWAAAAERDRLVKVNEGLVKALEKVAQIQRDKCENASAEMLFILLDNKVGIARAALDEARQS